MDDSSPKQPNIQHYADGTASVMRKAVVYTELRFYQRSDVLYQLTQIFCQRYLPQYGDRTVDQIVQAARSTKQNIVEGSTDGRTSTETELKLLGIARGSNQELLEDYQMGLFTDGDNFVTGNYFYNVYQPNIFWGGNPKPWISLLVSCDNCETVDVPELEKKNLTVYPNPATNHFTVNTGNDEKASIQLFNIVGQQVYSETFTGSTTVNVANLHSGVYMLKVNQNGKVNTTKVVVK